MYIDTNNETTTTTTTTTNDNDDNNHSNRNNNNKHSDQSLRTVHPVSITRFASFRTQPLESLSVDSVQKTHLSNPAPGENLESGNLVMETGCTQGGRAGRPQAGRSATTRFLSEGNFI